MGAPDGSYSSQSEWTFFSTRISSLWVGSAAGAECWESEVRTSHGLQLPQASAGNADVADERRLSPAIVPGAGPRPDEDRSPYGSYSRVSRVALLGPHVKKDGTQCAPLHRRRIGQAPPR